MYSLLSAVLCGLIASTATNSQTTLLPIKEVKDAKVKELAFKDAKRDAPIKITTLKDAEKYLEKATLGQIKKDVDFEKQIVLVFAWQGSGGDRLEYAVAESFPEQITFSIKPGLTDDLRSHTRVFVLRSNVKWKVK